SDWSSDVCSSNLRKGVFWLGQSGDVQLAVFSWLARKRLRVGKRDHDRGLLRTTGSEYPRDCERGGNDRHVATSQRNRVGNMDAMLLCECGSDHTFLGTFGKPAAGDLPPRVRLGNSGAKFSALRQRNGMVCPRPDDRNVLDPIPGLMNRIVQHKRPSLTPDLEDGRKAHDVEIGRAH